MIVQWLRRWREDRAGRRMEREIERMIAQCDAMHADWRALHGDEPFPLSPEERRAMRQNIASLGPEMLAILRAKGWNDPFRLLEQLEEDEDELE